MMLSITFGRTTSSWVTSRAGFSLPREMLKSVAVTHRKGKIDFDNKPGNYIIVGDKGKKLDLGGVISFTKLAKGGKIDLVYTDGFAAPEIAHPDVKGIFGPGTEIYMVGRAIFQMGFGVPDDEFVGNRARTPPA